MTYIRLVNDNLARMLHHFLYERLVAFNAKYCPEQPPDISVTNWLARLFSDDPHLHILVVLEPGTHTIISHAVIDVLPQNASPMVICHQLQHDKPNLESLDIGMKYIENVAKSVNACSIIFFATQHSEAFMKRYKFQAARTMMVKHVTQTEEVLTPPESRVSSNHTVLSPV